MKTASSVSGKKHNLYCDHDGFTLMEVLIAITLTAIILGIVSSAVNIGRNAWEKGDDSIKTDLFNRWLETSVRRQIGSLDFRNYENFFTSFKWTETEMTFLSCAAITGGDMSAVYYVKYFFEKNMDKNTYSLVVEEQPISEKVIFESNGQNTVKNPARKILFDSAEQIVFSYVKTMPSGENVVAAQWKDRELPDAVKLSVRTYDGKNIEILVKLSKMIVR